MGPVPPAAGAFYPELAAATELLLVPMEFRHQTSRLDLSGPAGP
jgi:hypothetical protein